MNMNKEFFIIPEEVFRVGNSGSPRLHMVRPSEVDITEINGVKLLLQMVVVLVSIPKKNWRIRL